MTVIHWSPNLSVGVDKIDADHKELIGMLDRLASDVGAGAEEAVLARDLDALIARTEQHFRFEETIMFQEDYPERDHHCRVHGALLAEIREFCENLGNHGALGSETAEFIRDWLVGHIMESDKHLGGYLEGRASP